MFQRPPYIAYINSVADGDKIKVIKADGSGLAVLTAANAIDATFTRIIIEDLGNFLRENVSKIVKVVGVNPNRKRMTFTVNVAAYVKDASYNLVVARIRDGFKDVRDSQSDRRDHRVSANAGETNNTMAARIAEMLKLRSEDDETIVDVVSVAGNVITLEGNVGENFDIYAIEELTGAKAVTVALERGINSPLQTSRFVHPTNNHIDNIGYVKFPAAGVTYTEYKFVGTTQLQLGSRETPNEFKANQQEFRLYVNNDLTGVIAALDALLGAADIADNVEDANVTADNA